MEKERKGGQTPEKKRTRDVPIIFQLRKKKEKGKKFAMWVAPVGGGEGPTP